MGAGGSSKSISAGPIGTHLFGWTIDTFAAHYAALHEADKRFEDERDRRYMEVNIEKEKALKIKETADRDALSLARDAQTYKDQQADIMRDKTLADSGIYATNASVAAAIGSLRADFQPLFDFVAGQKGVAKTSERISGRVYAFAAILAALLGSTIAAVIVSLLT